MFKRIIWQAAALRLLPLARFAALFCDFSPLIRAVPFRPECRRLWPAGHIGTVSRWSTLPAG